MLENAGAYTVTFPSSVVWVNGIPEFETDGILILGSVDETSIADYLIKMEDKRNDDGIRIVLCKEYTNEESKNQCISEADRLFKSIGMIDGVAVNAVLFDANSLEIHQIHDEGQKWVEEFIESGCSDSFVKASYIAKNTSYLLSDNARFIYNTILYVR